MIKKIFARLNGNRIPDGYLKKSAYSTPGDIPSLADIPKDINYLKLCERLCERTNGVPGRNFDLGVNKVATFRFESRKGWDVEVTVSSESDDGTVGAVSLFCGQCANPQHLKPVLRNVLTSMDITYGPASISYSGDLNGYLDFLSEWRTFGINDEIFMLPLRTYHRAEGTATCFLKFKTSEFAALIILTPYGAETADQKYSRRHKMPHYELIAPPGTEIPECEDIFFDDREDDWEDDWEDDDTIL